MTQYSLYVRDTFGIPLDRMFCGSVRMYPKPSAFIWKWEVDKAFGFSEMPSHIFERRSEIFGPDEPFCVLEEGRAEYIRIKDSDPYIPIDTEKWFRAGNYKDYFALPFIHQGISKGGFAWSTKALDGFRDDDIKFFRMIHAALSTVMRLHTNDMVLNMLSTKEKPEPEYPEAEFLPLHETTSVVSDITSDESNSRQLTTYKSSNNTKQASSDLRLIKPRHNGSSSEYTRVRRRRVSFDVYDDVCEVLHLHDYSPIERARSWYDREDMQRMRETVKAEAKLAESGRLRGCPRGLEAYTREGMRRKLINCRDAYASVFSEIDMHQYDDETIADAYFLFSEPCATEAQAIGRRDELAVRTMSARWRRIQQLPAAEVEEEDSESSHSEVL